MGLSYCHEELSDAVHDLCVRTLSLKKRLRNGKVLGCTALPVETLPDSLRELFSEIKEALNGVRVGIGLENYPDAIDRMKPSEVRRLIGNIFLLHEGVAREYYRRSFTRKNPKDAPEK